MFRFSFANQDHGNYALDLDDAGAGGAAAVEDPSSAAGVAAEAVAEAMANESAESAVDPSGAAAGMDPGAGTPEPQPQTPQYTGVLDYLRSVGHDVSQWQDDREFVAQAIRALQENAQLRQYEAMVRQVSPHWSEFQQWRQQQSQVAAARQAEEQNKRWHPGFQRAPEFAYVERDPQTGGFRIQQGAIVPPDTLERYQKYMHERAEWINNLADNPAQALEPFAQEVVGQAIQQVQQMFQQQQQYQVAQNMIGENRAWMFNPDGRTMSPMGQRYAQHVQALANAGVVDPGITNYLAKMATIGELASMQQQAPQQPAVPTPQATPPMNGRPPARIPAGATRAPGAGHSLRPGAPSEEDRALSLREMLQRDIAEAQANGVELFAAR